MEINCDKIAENYLLIQNPLYSFSFPIAVLVAIIVFGFAKAYKWSNNSYVNQILIPVLALLLTMVIIDIISRLTICKNKKNDVTQMCNKWIHSQKKKIESFSSDVSVPNIKIPPKKVNDFLNEIEKNNNPVENLENVIDPISEIPNISPSPLPFKPNGNICIENSNGCNICSGSDKNPYNLIAPIPGPQWLPQSAKSVQNRLKNNDYTSAKCNFI